ncbi:spore germination protein [Virgibacillus halodenitrificans]|uniref:spore germination protein n=1 Tax=Virgibacillus halodenitrificans TaxID=1482 RepID=UPI001F402BCB|nr:spore germination protein [Virgibacillus halodenitrificans]
MFNIFSKKNKEKHTFKNETRPYQSEFVSDQTLSNDLHKNISIIKESFADTADLVCKAINWNGKNGFLLYLETLVDNELIENHIIKPIKQAQGQPIIEVITALDVKESTKLSEIVKALTSGFCAFLLPKSSKVTLIKVSKQNNRPPEEPFNEQVIRGAHIGFIEDLNTNINIIRNQVQNPKLKVEYITLGKTVSTKVAIMYFDDLANKELITKVKERIQSISADFIQIPGYIQEYIEDRTYSPFPQTLNTERPDRLIANLMDGRVGIMMNGTPTCLIAPSTLISFFQSPDDYNGRVMIGSFYRFIRVFSFFVTIGLPALYIAVVSFHYESVPVELLFAIKSSLEPIPVPPLLEAIFMAVTLELIREATIRLPNPVAQTIGVVGGLVIGNAVVDANLVSNMMIIVIAITAISSFIMPSTEMSTTIRLLSFPLMLAAALFGLIGIVIGFLIIVIHLCKLESFGSPYFAPFGPLRWKELKDTIIRFPTWMLNSRPKDAQAAYRTTQAENPREWNEKNE